MNGENAVQRNLGCVVWSSTWLSLAIVAGPINVGIAQEPQTILQKTEAAAEEEKPQLQTVTLRIDYGDGFEKVYGSIEWRDGLTISDMMQHASQHAHPTKFQTRGKDATAFLSSIDGIENQGFRKKSWVFYVNGELGSASYAIARLVASDSVLWRYQKFP